MFRYLSLFAVILMTTPIHPIKAKDNGNDKSIQSAGETKELSKQVEDIGSQFKLNIDPKDEKVVKALKQATEASDMSSK